MGELPPLCNLFFLLGPRRLRLCAPIDLNRVIVRVCVLEYVYLLTAPQRSVFMIAGL